MNFNEVGACQAEGPKARCHSLSVPKALGSKRLNLAAPKESLSAI
jgi:hypothetical protein